MARGMACSWFAVKICLYIFILISLLRIFKLNTSDRPPSPLTPASQTSQNLHSDACRSHIEECRISAPFIFDSLFGLLKQWPNTYGANGHTIVPVTLPPNIPLYHVQKVIGMPPKPTWFAFEPEMSLGIYASSAPVVLHTYMSQSSISLLYIDGQSAVLTSTGALDSQTAILLDTVDEFPSYESTYNDAGRANELCKFAQEIKVDGFVRMNAGFEILCCDYAESKIKSLYVTNVTLPEKERRWDNKSLHHDPHRQPPMGYGNAFAEEYDWDWLRVGTWQYGGHLKAGGGHQEKRVSLDLCGMVSFYNPALTSLTDSHHGGLFGPDGFENGWGLRRGHRLLNVSRDDVESVRAWIKDSVQFKKAPSTFSRIQNLFSGEKRRCSGINWQALTEVIVDTHKERLMEVAKAFQDYGSILTSEETILRVQKLTHNNLAAYLEYPGTVAKSHAETRLATISRCSSLYTQNLPLDTLNEQELLLKDSIHIVLENLCGVEWELFEWSDSLSLKLFRSEPESSEDIDAQIKRMGVKTTGLLSYIGWDLWDGCPRKCAIDELCYIPMWPVIYGPGMHQGGIFGGSVLDANQTKEFWTPKCMNRKLWALHGGRGREPLHRFPDVPGNTAL